MRVVLFALMALMLSACNTAQGVKKDVERGAEVTGEALQKGGEAVGSALNKTGEVVGGALQKSGEAVGSALKKSGDACAEGGGVMDKFVRLEGLVAPLDRNNVDTDAIIPKQFLKSIKRSGFGPNAFDEWRYMDVGQPGEDNSVRPKNPNFVLNQERYQGAQVLLTRANFGLWQLARTRAVGAAGFRLSGNHRRVVCRYFLQ